MDIREYLMKARQDDIERAGERDRLLLEAQRARKARRYRPGPAAPTKRLTLARLLFRWATASATVDHLSTHTMDRIG